MTEERVEGAGRGPVRPRTIAIAVGAVVALIAVLVATRAVRNDTQAARSATSVAAPTTPTTPAATSATSLSASTSASQTTTSGAPTASGVASTTVVPGGIGAAGVVPQPTPTSAPAATARVPQGTWGGTGIQLVVTAAGGTVEYNCAAGVIAEPLTLDAAGSFAATGTHSFLRGGPPDPGAPPPRAQPARYTGSSDGATMRLTVTLPEAGTTLGPFTLVLGQRALLDRCG